MRSHYRALALVITLAAAPAFAQSGGTPNPAARSPGGEVFFYGPLSGRQPGQTFGRGLLDNTGIGRPNPRGLVQVTPVPEPSQWALMIGGLAVVAFAVRRRSKARKGQ